MLHRTATGLATGLIGQGPLYNALIESFAVHLRNLIDFLYEEKTEAKPDWIFAQDYFSDPQEWILARPDKSEILKKAEIKAHKQVAHLTYVRRKKEPWRFIEIMDEIYRPLSVFINKIDRGLLGDFFGPIEFLFPRP